MRVQRLRVDGVDQVGPAASHREEAVSLGTAAEEEPRDVEEGAPGAGGKRCQPAHAAAALSHQQGPW